MRPNELFVAGVLGLVVSFDDWRAAEFADQSLCTVTQFCHLQVDLSREISLFSANAVPASEAINGRLGRHITETTRVGVIHD